MINLITRISVVGIAAITAALIILLSAFNGIEKMIEELYSEYDTDITIRPEVGKTFNERQIDIEKLESIDGVINYTRAVEEVVILKHEKKWVNAKMIGIDSSFLNITNMSKHMIDGDPTVKADTTFELISLMEEYDDEPEDTLITIQHYGVIGAGLLDKLDGYIPENVGHETIICYVPKRKIKIGFGKNPFRTNTIRVSGRMNYNREVNSENFVVPIDFAKELMLYDDHISAIYVDVDPTYDNESVRDDIKELIGSEFVVKTNFEKNELIYKTSRSEKLIVLFILLFIFILAAFNLVASLTMLFVEKLDNIETMQSFGANRKFIFNIFFFEGLLIAGKGILFGALAGYLICFLQLKFSLLTMPNSAGDAFPIAISWVDGVLIISMVTILSVLFSYFPVKYLIYKNVKSVNS
ncbi:MAG: ABC transporter permease [Crocinitomicaceae bacterium]|nr:ABC transporter permease [Crocinitomicaceae bacterium]